MPRYECDHCGACCQGHLIVEADDIDVLRDSRIIDADRYQAGKRVETVVEAIRTEGQAVLLAAGRPCPFLNEELRCSIYPTRPNVCVGMAAGDEQCQEARGAAGLPPLAPGELHELRLPERPRNEL